ncbi:hypothetical protein HDU96_005552 [Phlyctochytrium bullatum]|nr:hypothetical protein HDU96_005552 [Phlyctochytrium bullatum]
MQATTVTLQIPGRHLCTTSPARPVPAVDSSTPLLALYHSHHDDPEWWLFHMAAYAGDVGLAATAILHTIVFVAAVTILPFLLLTAAASDRAGPDDTVAVCLAARAGLVPRDVGVVGFVGVLGLVMGMLWGWGRPAVPWTGVVVMAPVCGEVAARAVATWTVCPVNAPDTDIGPRFLASLLLAASQSVFLPLFVLPLAATTAPAKGRGLWVFVVDFAAYAVLFVPVCAWVLFAAPVGVGAEVVAVAGVPVIGAVVASELLRFFARGSV